MGASRLLAQYVTQDPNNDVAWLWLAACLDEPEQQRYCLKKASAINPNNPDTLSSLNELINPPWAWREPAEAIELSAGNGSPHEEEPAPVPETPVFVFPEPESVTPRIEDEREAVVMVETPPQPEKSGLSGTQVAVLAVLVIAIIAVLGYLGYMVVTSSPDTLPPFLRNLIYGSGIILGPVL
jgi:hypothetical protein